MKRNIFFLPFLILSLFIITSVSYADVVLEDIRANNRFTSGPPFDSGVVETGNGNLGDYNLIACGVVNPNGNNSFNQPSPGPWTELDNDECGGDFSCIGGIWGSFTNSDSQDINCSWTDQNSVFVFASGSFRYSNVDTADPIIDIECNSGVTNDNNQGDFPSINTEAGSQVVYILTRSNTEFPGGEPFASFSFNPDPGDPNYNGNFFADAFNTFQHVAIQGETFFFPDAGPTSVRTFEVLDGASRYRACTIGLRMAQPVPSSVPTMSEWGLITFAAFAGIAGLWYLRRRQVTA